jgi:hypothetical protein
MGTGWKLGSDIKMTLPFVKDELITEFSNKTVDFQAIYDDLKKTNPHLLNYIINFPNYLKEQGIPVSPETQGYLVNLSLSVCLLLNAASNQRIKLMPDSGPLEQSPKSK